MYARLKLRSYSMPSIIITGHLLYSSLHMYLFYYQCCSFSCWVILPDYECYNSWHCISVGQGHAYYHVVMLCRIFVRGGVWHIGAMTKHYIGGSGGMPPSPRKIFNLRPFRLHFRPILTKNQSRYGSLAVREFTPVGITITFKNFLAGEGGLVLAGTSQGSPLLNRTLYTM